MLDYFCIFSKGGAILWTFQLAALKGNPVEALIRACLLEDRTAEKSFTYTPKDGSAYTLKWRLHNELGLVFVAVYQRSLSLSYVDELLDNVLSAFVRDDVYTVHKYQYDTFNDTFRQLLLEAENRSAELSKASRDPKPSRLAGSKKSGTKETGTEVLAGDEGEEAEDDGTGNGTSDGAPGQIGATEDSDPGSGPELDTMEARLRKLKLGGKGGKGRGRGAAKEEKKDSKEEKKTRKKEMRNWNQPFGSTDDEPKQLDFACDLPPTAAEEKQELVGPSGMDVESEVKELVLDEEEEDISNGAGGNGFLASMVRSLKVNVVGGESITRDDIQPALEALKKKLMERNVGHDIVDKIADSVAASLEGKKLASFTRVSKVVYQAVEDTLTRILTPARSIDILREVQVNKSRPGNRPYVITFVGVNGVGKSTNLAKVAYWLIQHGMTVTIAACDTFRSGAVEQLKTHCQRLGVSLYERGYEKDPAKVAFEGIKHAERERADVLLVDTAGRMQDNEPLMKALAHLISLNHPDLVLFVGEALVGNDAIDQLTKFNQRLTDLADARDTRTRAIDGIVLTKFDTIDDKVGAAISMVYTSGAPVMFVGCGQTYVDLKRLNTKEVVNSLLS